MVRHDTGVGGGRELAGGGVLVVQPPLLLNVTKCKVEFSAPLGPELAQRKNM